MEKHLQIFNNPAFGSIRTIEEEGKILFCGTDIAKSLGYIKPRNAIANFCKGALKRGVPTEGGIQEMNFIPEGDVYRLIARSRLPAAEKFERWVFDEVLPSIRQTGSYGNAATQQMEQMAVVVDKLGAIVEQISAITACLAQAVSSAVKTSSASTAMQVFDDAALYQKNSCKLERAPQWIREQVDVMFQQMIAEQSMNFSAIARFCLLNGFYVSNPAVRTYYDRHFEVSRRTD